MQHLRLLVWGFWSLFLISNASIIPSKEKHHSSVAIRGDLYQADFKCPHFFGVFHDPNDCTVFHVCVAGKVVTKKCGFFQKFERWTKRCLPSFLVICDDNKDSTTTVSPTKITSQSTTRVKIESTTKKVTIVTSKTTTVTPKTSTVTPKTTTVAPKPPTITPKTTVKDIKTTTFRPTGPPDHTCDEDDVDCIITETGDVEDWFVCPQDVGSYVHPSSDKLFIFCMNWIPSAKKCGLNLVFSEEMSTCIEQ